MLVKSSVFLLYLRIFRFAKGMRQLIWTLIVFHSAFYVAAFLVTIFQCRPIRKKFNPLVPGHCVNNAALALVSAVQNIVIDLTAFLLPMREVLRLKISHREKIQLVAVFAVALL